MNRLSYSETNDPQSMLEMIRHAGDPWKLRLFGLACCRRIEHLLFEGPIRDLIGLIERCAEGDLSDRDLYWASWDRHEACYRVSIDGEAASAVLAAAGLPPEWVIGQLPSGVELFPVVRKDVPEPRLVSAIELAALHSAAALAWEADPCGYESEREAANDQLVGCDWPRRARFIARQMTRDARWAVAFLAAEKEQVAWLRESFET